MWWRDQRSLPGRAERGSGNAAQATDPAAGFCPAADPAGRPRRGRALATLMAVLTLAAGLAGCFEPLYGERTLAGGPGLRDRLASVEVQPIRVPNGSPQARVAVELRNNLIFDLTGGSGGAPPTHTLRIEMSGAVQQVIVDNYTARADVQQYGINVIYTLTEIATGKPVVTGQTFARVAFDNPGQQQRFANARGQKDAEDRAAKSVADQIKSRLASYFSAGA